MFWLGTVPVPYVALILTSKREPLGYILGTFGSILGTFCAWDCLRDRSGRILTTRVNYLRIWVAFRGKGVLPKGHNLRSYSQLLGEVGTIRCANWEKQVFHRFWLDFGCSAGAPHMQSVHAGAVQTHFSVFGTPPQKASHWTPFWRHFGDHKHTFGPIGSDFGGPGEALKKRAKKWVPKAMRAMQDI